MRRSLIVLLAAMNLRTAGSYSSAVSSTSPRLSWPPTTRILPLLNVVAVEPIRATAILPARENAPVASSEPPATHPVGRRTGPRTCARATGARAAGRDELPRRRIEELRSRETSIRRVRAARDQHVARRGNRGLD